MNLQNISNHLQKRKYKNEIEFFRVLYSFCHRYKVDYATFSSVGWDFYGSKITTFDKKGFSNTKYFHTKKVSYEQADENLTKFIEKNHIKKKDLIVIYESLFGLNKLIFYDAKTHKQFVVSGYANEARECFEKVVDLFHSL